MNRNPGLQAESKEGSSAASEKQKPRLSSSSSSSSQSSSSSSSPSHEFSFTVSHNSTTSSSSSKPYIHDSAKPQSSAAIDLSPADDIFFHGHLLPLHLLSHLHSTNSSSDTFTLKPQTTTINGNDFATKNHEDFKRDHITNPKNRLDIKRKSFSIFRFTKPRNGFESENSIRENDTHEKNHERSNSSNPLKRYVNTVRAFLSIKKREKRVKPKQQARQNSFSGNLSAWENEEEPIIGERKRLNVSAPATTRSSPRHSGHLVAAPSLHTVPSNSTMEELQSAIQAAIAHCKNSIYGDNDENDHHMQ